MSIPIIFVHQRDSFYLKYSLKQAKHFNKESNVFLLGDDFNNKYSSVTHVNLNEYNKGADLFAAVYKHRSTNPYDYELFCFQRWFYIRDFVKKNSIEEFVYLDSDVLAFYNFSDVIPRFGNSKIVNTGENIGMPAFIYFDSFKAIDGFCEYILNYYTRNTLVQVLDDWYNSYLKKAITMSGGICDMTIFDFFFKDNSNQTMKVDVLGDLVFDENISSTLGFETLDGIKKLYWIDNLPYCKFLKTNELMLMATLHYQGPAKKLMIKHYRGGGYKLTRIEDTFKMFFDETKTQIKIKIKKIVNYKAR